MPAWMPGSPRRALCTAWAVAWLLSALALSAWAGPRREQVLDDWRFVRADAASASAPDFDDAAWASVTLPHTWNAVDGEAGGAYYRGPAWYRRSLDWAGGVGRVFLEFDGAALATEVWVNGKAAGRHEGGYARFRIDITPWLHPGANTLAVRVDNAHRDDVAPLGGDFTVFGGLYRPVRVIETAPLHLELLDHGSPGVSVTTHHLSTAQARLGVVAQVRNDSTHPQALAVAASLRDAQGRVVARQRRMMQLTAGTARSVELPLTLARPHRWQGVHDPYLYQLSVELHQGSTLQDTRTLPLGLRDIRVDPQRGLLLNGQPYALHGVNYFHPGRPGRGLAVGEAEVDEDLTLLAAMGATGLRLVHFQHPEAVYAQADRLGLLLWTEIPLNAALHDSEAFRANLAQQLRELMRQTGHHAAVAIWGLGNEVYQADAASRALLVALHRQAKAEDPQRLTAYAHCCAADDNALALTADLGAYNRYYGWYAGAMEDIAPWADALHARLPQRALGVSEYGAGAGLLHPQDPPQRPEPGGRRHPESYQARFHEVYGRALRDRPWLWGHFVWVAFDLASAGRHEGDRDGINDKGLVTYDRQVRKDAYFWYQALWSRAPMVHLTNRRFSPRPAGLVTLRAYTNGTRATLWVDEMPQGEATVVDHVATWPAVPLAPGRHRIRVRTDHGADDAIEWEMSE